MVRLGLATAVAVFVALFTAPSDARPRAGAPDEISAQARGERTPRARTRLLVRPRYPGRTYNSPYPLPYTYEYPGPNAVRDCVARYVEDFRPSGTVIVPRLSCRWIPG